MTPEHISVVEKILGANDDVAARNRTLLDAHGVHCVNVMASPGAGKTTLITHTALALGERLRVGVIEGDVASNVDTDKVRALGLPADPFKSVGFYAPPRVDSETLRPDVHSRQDVTSFCWSLAEFCQDELLPFLFADAEDDRSPAGAAPEAAST